MPFCFLAGQVLCYCGYDLNYLTRLQIFAYLFLFCSRSLCAGTVRFSPFVNETETVYELVDMNLFFYNVFMQWSASDESVLCRSLICI